MALTARRVFIASWSSLLALKVVLACALPLFADEAFYWLEGQHLAWAYSDLPGLAAWLARLGVTVGGDTLPGLRWPFLLLASALPWLGVRIARRWFGDAAGWRVGIAFLLLPLASLAGVLALPDVPLVFATLLAFDASLALLERATPARCAQLAFALALGATAHYRFAIALVAGGIGLVASPEGRALLRRPGVIAALAVGALAWLPVILFNLDEHAAGLRFQFVERHPWTFDRYGLKLQLLQWIVAGPLLYAAMFWALWQAWRRRRDARWAMLLCASGIPIVMFMVLAPFADVERVSFHWPLSAQLPLLCVLPWLLRDAHRERAWQWIAGSNALVCAALWIATVQLASHAGQMRLARAGFYPSAFAGWNAVRDATRERLAAMPKDTVLIGDNFILAAHLAFDLPAARPVATLDHRLNTLHGRALQLALWHADESGLPALARRPALIVVEEAALPFEHREAWNRHLCALFPGLRDAGEHDVDAGRKRLLFFRHAPGDRGACALPSIAYLQQPAEGATVRGAFDASGWAFQDGAGVASVRILLDGREVAVARYGREETGVRDQWPGTDDPNVPHVGFDARIDVRGVGAGTHVIALRIIGNDGRVRILQRRAIRVVPP